MKNLFIFSLNPLKDRCKIQVIKIEIWLKNLFVAKKFELGERVRAIGIKLITIFIGFAN